MNRQTRVNRYWMAKSTKTFIFSWILASDIPWYWIECFSASVACRRWACAGVSSGPCRRSWECPWWCTRSRRWLCPSGRGRQHRTRIKEAKFRYFFIAFARLLYQTVWHKEMLLTSKTKHHFLYRVRAVISNNFRLRAKLRLNLCLPCRISEKKFQ